ncbi:MAG: cytochrome C oxidase subunit IV family protein [Pseudomonadota bacterium]
MKTVLINPLHRTLLILVVVTGAAFWIRSDGLTGVTGGIATLAIVWLKGRLIVLDFMELRHAPALWRWLLQGWLMLTTALILLFYYIGRSGVTF